MSFANAIIVYTYNDHSRQSAVVLNSVSVYVVADTRKFTIDSMATQTTAANAVSARFVSGGNR